MENTHRSEAVKDGRGREITVGCKVRLLDPDQRREGVYYICEVEDIDSRQDKPGDPVVVIVTLPPLEKWDGEGRDKFEYADRVEVVADVFPTWKESK
jgi:hypothetical protein